MRRTVDARNIWRDMIFCFVPLPQTRHVVELVTRSRVKIPAAVEYETCPRGDTMGFTGGNYDDTSRTEGLNFGNAFGIWESPTTAISMFSICTYETGASRNEGSIVAKGSQTSSPWASYSISTRYSLPPDSRPKFWVGTSAGAASGQHQSDIPIPSGAISLSGRWRSGQGVELWVNGKLSNTSSTLGGSIAYGLSSDNNLWYAAAWNAGVSAQNNPQGMVGVVYGWARYLGASELRALHSDPFLPLRSPRIRPVYPHYTAKRR